MTPYEQAFQIGTSYAPRTVPSRSIPEIELEAREHGLSYGLYLAGHRLEKELEEAAARRQAEIKAMNVKRRKEAKRRMKRRVLERAEKPKPDRTPRKRYSVAVAEIDLEGNECFEYFGDAEYDAFNSMSIAVEIVAYDEVFGLDTVETEAFIVSKDYVGFGCLGWLKMATTDLRLGTDKYYCYVAQVPAYDMSVYEGFVE